MAVHGRPFRTLLRYNLPYKREYAAGAVLALAFGAFELGTPLVIRAVVQLFDSGRVTPRHLVLLFLVLLGIAGGAGVARYWQRTLMIRASRKFEYDLRNAYFRHVQSLSQEFFHRTKTGDIMARATNDLNLSLIHI